jgi:tRNA-dihydrouridine synthase A
MLDAVGGAIPVTVKHRIGIDKEESYGFVRDFVGTLAEAGCTTFIAHARNAWLKGLSPKENREIPPLRYDMVYQLKKDFPNCHISINGGIRTSEEIQNHLQHVDSVMVGREAYHNPFWLAEWDALVAPDATSLGAADAQPVSVTMDFIENSYVEYMEREATQHGTHWYGIARHMLGLRHGMPGARKWRQVWSDHRNKALTPREVMQLARGMS